MALIRILRLNGEVQGVGLRYAIKRKADQLKLKGWVQNEADGTVNCCLSDNQKKIEEFIHWLENNYNIDQIFQETTKIFEVLNNFEIRF